MGEKEAFLRLPLNLKFSLFELLFDTAGNLALSLRYSFVKFIVFSVYFLAKLCCRHLDMSLCGTSLSVHYRVSEGFLD